MEKARAKAGSPGARVAMAMGATTCGCPCKCRFGARASRAGSGNRPNQLTSFDPSAALALEKSGDIGLAKLHQKEKVPVGG